MNRVHVLVEGQTEEAVVGRLLKPHLWPLGVDLTAKLVATKRVASGPNHKGGGASWDRVAHELALLLRDSGVVAVTTLLDYYGLDKGFPGMGGPSSDSARVHARHIEGAMDAALGDSRMRSNLMVHEIETLLYVDPDVCGSYLGSDALTIAMRAAVTACGEPELVNDDPTTAPSKRIMAAHAAYRKTLDGPSILEQIGIDKIRRGCTHFGRWLGWLEALG